MRINDEELLASIARLSTNADFNAVMEKLFQKEYDNAVESCIREENPGRYQGKAEFLKDFIETVEGAREAHRSRNAPSMAMGNSL
jgi:hypothetical protein